MSTALLRDCATLCYMSTISHREMRNNSGELLRRVEAGETITVTNRGRPVARITPVRQSVLDELETLGQLRRATRSPRELRDIPRAKLSVTTAEILDDLRGDR